MRRRALLLVAVVAGLAVLPASAHAADVTVSTCDEASLRSAISGAASGDTIRFGCDGMITLTAGAGGRIEPGKDITIDGTGHDVRIDGNDQIGLFANDGSKHMTLRHLLLTRGASENDVLPGGAIWNAGDLVVDDVDFAANHSFTAGGAIANQGIGGSLEVSDSRFFNNVVTCPITGQGGGAIELQSGGPTTIRDSLFENNSSVGVGSGGAIHANLSFSPARTGPLEITRSTFRGNHLTVNNIPTRDDITPGGAAVNVYNHRLDVEDSTFDANTVDAQFNVVTGGGVAYAHIDGPLPDQGMRIAGSTFTNNAVNHSSASVTQGGALSVKGHTAVDVEGSTFTGNSADQGGGIAQQGDGPFTVRASSIQGNHLEPPHGGVDQRGGGVLAYGDVTFVDTQLRDNDPENCGAGSGSNPKFVDGGGSIESPGWSCRFPDPAVPTITVDSPADGSTVAQGQRLFLHYACATTGPSGIASCTGSLPDGTKIDTNTPGVRSITVTAVTGQGISATRTISYRVGDAPASDSSSGGSASTARPAAPQPEAVPVLPAAPMSASDRAERALGGNAVPVGRLSIGEAQVFRSRLAHGRSPLRLVVTCDQACEALVTPTVVLADGHKVALTPVQVLLDAGEARVLVVRLSKAQWRAVRAAGGGKLKVAVKLGHKTAVQTWSLPG